MSNTISSIGASLGMMMGMGRPQRPDSSKLATDLFSQIDTTGKGYIEKSDLESAFSQVSSSGSTSTADQLFSTLDSDSDGKVTQDELTAGIKKLSESLESQFQNQRMNEAMAGMGGMGGMPPPPPENDTGFTKEELQSQLDEIGGSDSARSSLISNIVQNFDAADTDGDGRVSFKEAMAYDQSASSGSSISSAVSGSTDSTTSASISDAQLMLKILQLMHAYGNNASTTSSVTASA